MMLKQEELFPCYLFCSLVNNTFWVYGFVNYAGKPQMVPDSLIEEVKIPKDNTIDLTLQSSDKVIINDGRYENIAAILLKAESGKRKANNVATCLLSC